MCTCLYVRFQISYSILVVVLLAVIFNIIIHFHRKIWNFSVCDNLTNVLIICLYTCLFGCYVLLFMCFFSSYYTNALF